jgi:transposase
METLLSADQLSAITVEPVEKATTPAGEAKTFRPYDPTQVFLLPPSLDDWLREDHEARFISEVVEDLLDLSPIYAGYSNATGAPPYHPRLMLKVLLYAYATGVTSSREIERRGQVDVAFRWLSANATPDYRSIARFRRRHLGALEQLFLQTLSLCATAGLVKLGRVALDGTKVTANASVHKAMSYEFLVPRIHQLEGEVRAILAEAEATDAAEDQLYGEDRRGDELDPELARRETRLVKLRAAKAALEQEAKEKAELAARQKAQARGQSDVEIELCATTAGERATPKPSAQRNFTDPESRMMKTAHGFRYAYNAQTVVDEQSQVVLATRVTQEAGDVHQLLPMIEMTRENLVTAGIEGGPSTILADAGYCSEKNLEAIEDLPVNVLVATGRVRPGERFPATPRGPIRSDATRRELMARRLRTKSGHADYARRKVIVEPVFGQMKVRQRAGQLRLRGLDGASGEWLLHVICHNLRKLNNARGVAATVG